jgi:hypothetical protein
MKKILPFLEKNVQWAALGLGAVYLFYMIWSFVIVNPAAKPLPGNTDLVTPSSVDRVIADGVAATLDQKARGSSPDFHISVPTNASIDLGAPATRPSELALGAWDSWQLDVSNLANNVNKQQGAQLVQALPTLPALNYLDQETLRTVLGTPDATGSMADKHDADAVTTFWSLPIKGLADGYTTAFTNRLPAAQQTVLFAHADLIRQEQLGDGTWGPEKVVDRVFNLPPPPTYPDPKDQGLFAKLANDYREWLQIPKSQRSIVSADFPTVAYSDNPALQWRALEDWVVYRADEENRANNPAAGAAAPTTGPSTPSTPNSGSNPFGQTQAPAPVPAPVPSPTQFPQTINPYANNTGPTVVRTNHRGGGSVGGRSQTITLPGNLPVSANGQPIYPNQAANQYQNQQLVNAQNRQLAAMTPAPAPMPAATGTPAVNPTIGIAAASAVAPAVVVPPTLPKLQAVPETAFNPNVSVANGDMELYFHDMTVEAGKTYRYKVRYGVFNPVFGNAAAVDKSNADIAKAFTIDSPDSAWSDPVAVQPRTRFWCSPKQPGHGQQGQEGLVTFMIFSWHDGTWQHELANAMPGDEIGDGQFLTHWTLLDVRVPRAGAEKRFVLLVPDNGGSAAERSELLDSASPEFQKFQHQYVDQPAAPRAGGNPAGPAPTGTPPAAGGSSPGRPADESAFPSQQQ